MAATTVAIRQINRTVRRAAIRRLFSPPGVMLARSFTLGMAELVRWVITYQNYTGVTDKTKIVAQENFSNDSGWLYRLSPVFAVGDTLFDTLLLNLILVQKEDARPMRLNVPFGSGRMRNAMCRIENVSFSRTIWPLCTRPGRECSFFSGETIA